MIKYFKIILTFVEHATSITVTVLISSVSLAVWTTWAVKAQGPRRGAGEGDGLLLDAVYKLCPRSPPPTTPVHHLTSYFLQLLFEP